MFTTFSQALEFLYATLPMYQRVGATAFKKDLTNTLALCRELNNPHQQFKSVHVAGTNGKGSSAHLLASILQEAGYKTGLYTSPHLKSFTERIKINGREVPEEFVVDFVNRLQPTLNLVKPSFFETTVAMAFDYFARQQVDVAVIEVGLGGRLDSTNVITPVVSLITNIGFDHTDMLGDTLEQIAFEKAGIIKHGVPVVISERQTETTPVFQEKVNACNAQLIFAQDEYQIIPESQAYRVLQSGKVRFENLSLQLGGRYQQKNLHGVLATVDQLISKEFTVHDAAIRAGIENVLVNTGLKGRWQILGTKPLIICDTAHNAEGMKEVIGQIMAMPFNELYFVLGLVKDKDHHALLSLLPAGAHYFFCQASIPRALAAHELAGKAQAYGLKGEVIADVNQAIAFAKQMAQAEDLVFIGGSTFVVAEINGL